MAAFALPFDRPRTAILVWPGDEPETAMYGGEQIVIPAREQVATVGDKFTPSIFRWPAATDRQGRPIAGTVSIKDVMRIGEQGESIVVFSAEGWCKGLRQCNQKLFERGFAIVIDPEDVPAAMEAGLKRWRRAKVAEWDNAVRYEMARRENYRTKGQVAPPLDDLGEQKLQNAIRNLRAEQDRAGSAISDSDLRVALGGPVTAPALPVVPVLEASAPAPKEAKPEDELGEAADNMYRLAREHKIHLTKNELDGLLSRDMGAMAELEQKLTEAGVEL